jgi:hypothetical protein
MKARVRLLLAFSLVSVSPSIAQHHVAPSPEMQKLLNAMSGTWTCHFEYAPSERLPNGGTVVSDITPNSFTQTLSQGEAGKELKTILTIHATRKDAATNN